MAVDSPIVSVIMPAYNAEKYIAESIQSILNQTYGKWELIVVNDGSNDDTCNVVNLYKDHRIKILSQVNKGVSSARNLGLEKAKGKYITFLDADDTLPPSALDIKCKYLENHPNVDAIHGIISIRDEALKIQSKSYEPFQYENILTKALKLDGRLFFNPGYMVRYNKLNNIKFKQGMTHCEDILFLITLFSSKISYASIPETVYCYRVFDSSAMSNIDAMINGYFDLLKNVMKIPSISYSKTLVMRLKIMRVMLSWYIRKKNIVGLFKIFKVFKS